METGDEAGAPVDPPVERRPPLTRERIVAAAVELADTEGLAAVSLRRIAERLPARTMSLYAHIESKDRLLALMADAAAAGHLVPEPLPDDWREALRRIARRSRGALLAHPWVVDLAGRTPPGPNGLRHVEQSLAALASLDAPPAVRAGVLAAVDDYTLGHVVRELVDRRSSPDLRRPQVDALAGGGFPRLAALAAAGEIAARDDDADFETGLGWLLDGIAAALQAP
jgi:AcrR family transcriptional regulator